MNCGHGIIKIIICIGNHMGLSAICIGNRPHSSTFGNNCTSDSRVIVRGVAEYNFECYMYNYSKIL